MPSCLRRGLNHYIVIDTRRDQKNTLYQVYIKVINFKYYRNLVRYARYVCGELWRFTLEAADFRQSWASTTQYQ